MKLDAGIAGWWCMMEIFEVLFTKFVCVIFTIAGWLGE
jgi:hypothetical protein